jgi:HSP20 family protein
MYRRFRTPSAWQELDRLQREMNRLFDNYSGERRRVAPGYPAMNVWNGTDSAVITAELPGVDPDSVDISIVGETLTLSGERQPEEMPEGARYHRQERGYGRFTRAFQLPFLVDANNVEARFEKGVLQISLPRAEADKPKKITVKAA